MSSSVVVSCSSCGKRNRLAYDKLDKPSRCGACQSDLPKPGEPVEVDRLTDLQTAIERSALPVLVDYWAAWCGPCVMVAPEVKKVADRGRGRLLVVKANTESDPQLGLQHRIRSIPTLALFRSGRELARISGALPAEGIEEFVEQALAGG